jgi:hypothetical protein
VTSAAALYYPYIHFRDEAWVKQAALYWDNVARIVPGGYGERLHDGDVVKALRDEAGVVVDREPEDHVVETVSEELCRFVDAHADALAQHFSPDPVSEPSGRPTAATNSVAGHGYRFPDWDTEARRCYRIVW